jgi:hypothetical protein
MNETFIIILAIMSFQFCVFNKNGGRGEVTNEPRPIIQVSNHSSSSSFPKIALYTRSPLSLTTSSVWMLCKLYTRSSGLLPSVPSLAAPKILTWIYAFGSACSFTLAKRCTPYADVATRTASMSEAVKDARSASETWRTAAKYSGSCSAIVTMTRQC